ncbi:fibronectin type III domain-containing protein [Marivirga tractuosa]|nr:fibronectin type III domain-containing protein [Marivirga tractuosa]
MAKAEVSAQGTSAPVQVNSQLTPPNSIYLSDYANASLNKWPITLTLRDFTKSDYRVRLRITIESQTVRLRTKPSFRPTGMYLNAGIPTQVPYDKLGAYLNPNNLEISGINPSTFSNSQQLPEGFYTFTVEVLDYQRGNVVSNLGRSVAWIVQNDPPLLNLPYEDKLRIQEPQQVQFQWTPRHTASPNSAFETEYIFRLWEIWPADRNPFEVVRTSNPIFEQRTNLNSYFYGPADIQLIPGRSYAWQVQAVSNIGRDLFKNDGKSVVESFQYGDECLPITGLGIEALGPDRIKADWTGDWNHSGYVVKVRESGTTEWTSYATNIETQVLFDLETDTEYEVQVFSKCGVLTGEGSDVLAVRTLAASESNFECGVDPDNPAITNREPIANLQVGDKIEALGFKVRITELSGSGPYNGKGAIEVPLFNLAGVKADLVNIEVNTDKKLIGGFVETTLNPAGPFIVGLGGGDELDEGNADTAEDGTEETPDTDIEVDEVISDVDVDDETGVITVTTEDGETTTIDPDEEGVDENDDGDIVIEDSNGDTWVVGPDGNVSQGQNTGGPSNPNTLPSDANVDFIVNFEKSDQQQYGFDAKSLETLSSYYTQTQVRDNDYWLAWKSVASGRTDKVLAKQSSGDSFNNAIGFKTITGNLPITAASEDLAKNVTVQGTTHQDEQVVQAYVLKETQDDQGETSEEEIILGELNVVSYDKLSQKVVIVPVNGVSAPTASTLSNELNRIYGQAVAEWEVVMAGNYTSEMSLDGLDDEGSSTFSAYSSAMNDFKREYKRNNNIDRDAYYVFLMSGTGSSKLGYMPFKRQYGFIFSDNTNELTKTIAHELGHGAFRLRHTFSNEGYIASQGSTNNLMDYSDGTKLYKHQWDLVHDPENVNTLFEDEEESAMGGEIEWVEFDEFQFSQPMEAQNKAGFLTYLTPTGYPITLPFDAQPTFSGTTNNDELNDLVVNGVLLGFRLGSDLFTSSYGKRNGNWMFKGYKKLGSDNYFYKDENSSGLNSIYTVIVGKYEEENCAINIGLGDYQQDYTAIEGNEEEWQTISAEFSLESISIDYTTAGKDYIDNNCIKEGPGKYFYDLRKDNGYISESELIELSILINNLHESIYDEYVEESIENLGADDLFFYDLGAYNSKESYNNFKEALIEFNTNKSIIKDTFIEIINSENSSSDEALRVLSMMTVHHCETLTAENRIKALKKLNEGVLTGNWFSSNGGEFNVIKLISTTPENQIPTFFDGLRQDDLIADLDKGVNNFFGPNNYTKFIIELSKLFYQYYETNPANEEMLSKLIDEGKIIRWTSIDMTWVQENEYSAYYSGGDLIFKLSTTDWEIGDIPDDTQSSYALADAVTEVGSETEFTFNPFEPVGIFFETQDAANQIGAVAGETYIFPAFYFLWLKNDSDNEKMEQGISDAVLIGSFFYGGAELVLAKNIIRFAIALGQLNINIIGVILDEETRENLKDNGFEDFLIAFDILSIGSEMVSLREGNYQNAVNLINIWSSSKNYMSNFVSETEYDQMDTFINNLDERLNTEE